MPPKKKTKKGKVFVHTSKSVYPYEMLQKAEKSGSKQLPEVAEWMTENDLIPTPYPPLALLTLYESNPIFFRCVNQLAIDVAGLGWDFKLKEGAKESETELNRLKDFVKNLNPDDSFRTLLKMLLIDWGTIGYFGIEVQRNNKGDVAQIHHVPAHTLRVHKSKEKYAQIRNQEKVWFKKFGLEGNIAAKDGKKSSSSSVKDRANELIFYRNYYPKSDYYGVTNAISAIGDVVGLIGLRDYNLAFFENYGIPAGLIILEGDWEDGSEDIIKDFLEKQTKGAENAHRTMVVSQPKGVDIECKFTYEKLGVEVKEGSFRLYEQGRRDNVMVAFSMPPERVGIRIVGKLGGNVAEEATQIYVSGVVEPLQLDLEEIINEKLLQSEIYELKFKNIDLRDYDKLIDRLVKEVGLAIKTPNEARNELGLEPYEGGDKFYVPSTLIDAGEVSDEAKLGKTDEDSIRKLLEEDK